MDVMTVTEQASNGSDNPLLAAKSLKKKKSLKQLFIPSKQKSFKVRSVSSPESQQPHSAPHESHPLPYNLRGLSTAPPKTFSVMFNERMPDRVPDSDILQATETLWADSKAKSELETGERAHTTHHLSRDVVIAQPSEDWQLAPTLEHDGPPLDSPRILDQSVPDASPNSLQRRVTDSIYDLTNKPTVYVPKTSKNSQSPVFLQTAAYTREPRSPDISHTVSQIHSARFASYESKKSMEPPLPDQCQRVPWDPVYDVRGSFISGQSTVSSYVDSARTKHSSVFTKDSAISDTTIDADYGEERKHSMTVDEAIDMYVAGFEDDKILEGQDLDFIIAEEEVNRRSARIAEAVGDSMGPLVKPPRVSSLTIPSQASSSAIVSGEVFRDLFHCPPALLEPTATHDRYGFRKASRDITIEAYDVWYRSYAAIQERMHVKWLKYLRKEKLSTENPESFPAPSLKTQKFVRRGISPGLRGEAWFFYSKGNEFLKNRPEYYSELVLKCQTAALLNKDKEAIERDLHRTFPENLHFKPHGASQEGQVSSPPAETPIISALRRLLSAFAIHNPAVGYCQSLNFIAGLLLLFLPEEKAFWMLHIITTSLLPGSHEESLEGADVDTWVLLLALQKQNSGLQRKIGGDVQSDTRHLPDISMCTTPWFMSAFIGNLPIEGVLRVWDVLFYEGSKTLFRVALAIFKIGEEEIRKIQDPMETLQVIQTIPRKMLDVERLFDFTFSRGEVGKKWIEKKRQERKQYHVTRRAAEEP